MPEKYFRASCLQNEVVNQLKATNIIYQVVIRVSPRLHTGKLFVNTSKSGLPNLCRLRRHKISKTVYYRLVKNSPLARTKQGRRQLLKTGGLNL